MRQPKFIYIKDEWTWTILFFFLYLLNTISLLADESIIYSASESDCNLIYIFPQITAKKCRSFFSFTGDYKKPIYFP